MAGRLVQFPISSLDAYVCPACRAALVPSDVMLVCAGCAQKYPVLDGLPDFVRDDLSPSELADLPSTSNADRPRRSFVVRFGELLSDLMGRGSTRGELVGEISAMLQGVRGRVLDAACGTGIYGRRVASDGRELFGIDRSLEALRHAVLLTKRERVERMHFARSKVESLPFASQFFDAALCCGALHQFENTARALTEIARTMKPDAPFAGITFTADQRENWNPGHESTIMRRTPQAFRMTDLEAHLTAAGFDSFQHIPFGTIVVFRGRRRRTQF
jgi:ubiquinone/menaquinone biosynthesis C-methylase UbiE/uncharacterized protein YbaR (Trm112 family)